MAEKLARCKFRPISPVSFGQCGEQSHLRGVKFPKQLALADPLCQHMLHRRRWHFCCVGLSTDSAHVLTFTLASICLSVGIMRDSQKYLVGVFIATEQVAKVPIKACFDQHPNENSHVIVFCEQKNWSFHVHKICGKIFIVSVLANTVNSLMT